MEKKEISPVISQVLNEQNQGSETRNPLFAKLENKLKRTVISYFTSFRYPEVMIENEDADILEGVLQKTDSSNGLVLIISSPGGYGLAAERIINICRNYSKTGEYWVIVPSKAKSAATMVCFGASKIIMSETSELGPIDPQITLDIRGLKERLSLNNIVESYNDLFKKAVMEKNNLQPYLLQLSNYDEREIKEFKTAISLSEDIAIRYLESGMMKGISKEEIKKNIDIFLKPTQKKAHGRPIYAKEALDCGLNIELKDLRGELWELIYELYIRTNNLVSTRAAKCIESQKYSFVVAYQRKEKK